MTTLVFLTFNYFDNYTVPLLTVNLLIFPNIPNTCLLTFFEEITSCNFLAHVPLNISGNLASLLCIHLFSSHNIAL